jgi:hypothetical protein
MTGARTHGPQISQPTQPDEIVSHDELSPTRSVTRRHVWMLAEENGRGAVGLARTLGVTPRTIFRWIHGRKPTYKNRLRQHRAIRELLDGALIP